MSDFNESKLAHEVKHLKIESSPVFTSRRTKNKDCQFFSELYCSIEEFLDSEGLFITSPREVINSKSEPFGPLKLKKLCSFDVLKIDHLESMPSLLARRAKSFRMNE